MALSRPARLDGLRSGSTWSTWKSALAPTGNIAVTNALLVNAIEEPLKGVSAGQDVYVQADFTTYGLPSGTSYRVGYTVNGLTRDSGVIAAGAGIFGACSWSYYLGYFIAIARHEPGHSDC